MEKITTKEQLNKIGTSQHNVIYIIKNGYYKAFIFVGKLGSNLYFADRENRKNSICLNEHEVLKEIEEFETVILFDVQYVNKIEILNIMKEQERCYHLFRMRKIDDWSML